MSCIIILLASNSKVSGLLIVGCSAGCIGVQISEVIHSVRGILCESTVILFEKLHSSDNAVISKTPFLFGIEFL